MRLFKISTTLLCVAFICSISNTIRAQNADSAFMRGLFNDGLPKCTAYKVLTGLCTQFPKRLSGSPGANAAAVWMAQQVKEAGADTVWLQPVMVPHWVRGKEKCTVSGKTVKDKTLAVTTLGGSIATPANGIAANIVEVKSFDELRTKNVKGKIVFYNTPFDATLISTFHAYGKAVVYRGIGASMAAKYGAVAVVVRSMASNTSNYPHTGAMHYIDTLPKIPAGAISTVTADELHELLLKDSTVHMQLTLLCRTLPDTQSYNVIGEWRGTDRKAGIIIVGGHLDAWDTGDGATDDGAGCVHSIEALRLLRHSGKRLTHTLRVVLYMNEENGTRGGLAMKEYVQQYNEKVTAAIESDAGGFTPRGFDFGCSAETYARFSAFKQLFEPYSCTEWHQSPDGSGGTDVGTLKGMTPLLLEFMPDPQRYFDVHHGANDTVDKINPRELELGACCIASLIYVLDITM